MLEDLDGEFLRACRRVFGGRADADATLLLSRRDIAALAATSDWLDSATTGFRAVAEGNADQPQPLGVHAETGTFHAKAANLEGDRSFVALKFNANFPDNRSRHALPTIQGAILLCDGRTGRLLAIMDSMEITLRRTAAASALAAQFLARPTSETILICGCGDQAIAQLEALRAVVPLRQGYCWDRDSNQTASFARMAIRAGFPMQATQDLPAAAAQSDVIVTCTTATAPFLTAEMVRPGTFIAAVGADSPHKSEIHPELLARSIVVVDSVEQCAAMGDLHHAIKARAVGKTDVHAELSELVIGAKHGRGGEMEISLFDSTGTAVQDVAAAAMIYRRALQDGRGRWIDLAE